MLEAKLIPYTLDFKFLAGTSRGVMKQRDTWFLKITNSDSATTGWGEAAPLPGLSIDFNEDLLFKMVEEFNRAELDASNWNLNAFWGKRRAGFPSLVTAFETAWNDLLGGGVQRIFESPFIKGEPIAINGLVWMGDKDFMTHQINEKIDQGFSCIKIKVGALDFDTELDILRYLRSTFGLELELRLDANGAFTGSNVFQNLEELSKFNVHSIEQPVAAGNWKLMQNVIQNSPIKIALDEELIGVFGLNQKKELLETLNPDFIILKPSLIGGFNSSDEWIKLSNQMNIGWWITSALESNIGLNAICQFCSGYENGLPQGLGTGSLFHNNIESPLTIEKGQIRYLEDKTWNIKLIEGD